MGIPRSAKASRRDGRDRRTGDRINLLGDVPALLITAVVLGALMPRGVEARATA
jgi:hypothetical protein